MKPSIDRKILATNVTEIRTRTRRELRTDNWELEIENRPRPPLPRIVLFLCPNCGKRGCRV
jgi:hypothetical protein